MLDINATRAVREFNRINERKSVGKCQRHMSGKAIAGTDMVDALDGRFIG